MSQVFITGATGYLGSALFPLLLQRGHKVTALVRSGSESKLPQGVHVVTGDALNPASLKAALGECDTWVQLIGVPHPSPLKAKLFRLIDFRAVTASLEALPGSKIRHYVYLSVAHPTPTMKAYAEVRAEGEELIRATGIAATFMRPFYVLGPGHRWPYVLIPFYKLLEKIPFARESALRLGLVTRKQMIESLVWTVENPPDGIRIMPVVEIRKIGRRVSTSSTTGG